MRNIVKGHQKDARGRPAVTCNWRDLQKKIEVILPCFRKLVLYNRLGL